VNRDRIERERNAAITRRAAGREIKAPDKYDPSEADTKKRERSSLAADLKAVQVTCNQYFRRYRNYCMVVVSELWMLRIPTGTDFAG
jgi:hypothetical protein